MEKSYVTMEQKLCLVCGKTFDSGNILLDKRLKKTFDKHTVTGYDLCQCCEKKKQDGYIALVVADPTKSTIINDNVKPEDVYRTGEIIHIKKEVAEKMFNNKIEIDLVYIDEIVAEMLKNKVKQ